MAFKDEIVKQLYLRNKPELNDGWENRLDEAYELVRKEILKGVRTKSDNNNKLDFYGSTMPASLRNCYGMTVETIVLLIAKKLNSEGIKTTVKHDKNLLGLEIDLPYVPNDYEEQLIKTMLI